MKAHTKQKLEALAQSMASKGESKRLTRILEDDNESLAASAGRIALKICRAVGQTDEVKMVELAKYILDDLNK